METLPHTLSQVTETIKNYLWYIYTTQKNSGGDVTSWIQEEDGKCKLYTGIVRREDGLIFQDTLKVRDCLLEDKKHKERGVQIGYFFRGTTLDGYYYDGCSRRILT